MFKKLQQEAILAMKVLSLQEEGSRELSAPASATLSLAPFFVVFVTKTLRASLGVNSRP